MTLRVLDLARADLREAALWYEEQRAGLGREFLAAVRRALAQIAENPRLYQRLRGKVRRAPLPQPFPHGAFYRIAENETIEVLAFLHPARNPAVWRRRGKEISNRVLRP